LHPHSELPGPHFKRNVLTHPRTTHRGKTLPGLAKNSYWSSELTTRGGVSSNKEHVEAFLARLLRKFVRARSFASRIRSTGGEVELWVSVFGKRNYALVLNPELCPALRAYARAPHPER
jgi:hypothetical protein